MASKHEMKQTFYNDLQTAVSGMVAQENIVLSNPERRESLPAVVYEEFSSRAPYNGSTVVRVEDETDSNGNTVQVFHEYILMRFDVYPIADGESKKDELYEAIRTHFNQYSMWNTPKDFHSHAKDVSVAGGASEDIVEDDEVVRADRMTIEVIFYRKQTN